MKAACFCLALILGLAVAESGCAAHTGEAARTEALARPVYLAPAPPGVIPAGTSLIVRVTETIVADRAADRVYSAETACPMVDSRGRTIVPAGSPAELMIIGFKRERAPQAPWLELAVRALSVKGRVYRVTTEIAQQGKTHGEAGATRSTALLAEGGALLGTIAGAIAGGGPGALMGATAGAAAGAGSEVLPAGERVRIPAETLLKFRLDRSIRLMASTLYENIPRRPG